MMNGAIFRGLVLSGLLALPAAVTPASAFDEGRGDTLNTILDIVGLGAEKENPNIQYRERAPLVLPPRTDLRPPREGVAQRNPNFPQDQETAAARRRQADRGRVRLDRVEEGVQVAGARELSRNPFAPSPANPTACVIGDPRDTPNSCGPQAFWDSLKAKSVDKPAQLQAGVEPERKYLTQPPKGYMAPKTTVKATFEAPRPRNDDAKGSDFFIEQARRSRQ